VLFQWGSQYIHQEWAIVRQVVSHDGTGIITKHQDGPAVTKEQDLTQQQQQQLHHTHHQIDQ
jgi:hypothetical protein